MNYVDPTGFFKSSPWLQAIVPGQVAWDNAVTCFENGNILGGIGWSGVMVAEQLIFVASFGQSKAASGLAAATSSAGGNSGLFFTKTAAQHMGESGRFVPIQILKDAIKSTVGVADPQGTSALMHYTTMYKNGKLYNLEVLYDDVTNTVMHFKYTQKALGPLSAIQ